MYLEPFRDFLIACVGASASFIGLLFVALSVVLARTDMNAEIEFTDRRLAESSFTALGNIFFITLISLTPHTNIGVVALIVALLSLASVARLFQQFLKVRKQEAVSERNQDIAWIFFSVFVYGAEATYGALLVLHPGNLIYTNAIMNVLLILFGTALVRTWGLTGIRKR